MRASVTHDSESIVYSAFIVGAPENVYSVFTGQRVRRHDTAACLYLQSRLDQSEFVTPHLFVLAPHTMLICFCVIPLRLKLARLRPAQFGVTHQDACLCVTSVFRSLVRRPHNLRVKHLATGFMDIKGFSNKNIKNENAFITTGTAGNSLNHRLWLSKLLPMTENVQMFDRLLKISSDPV